LVVNKRFRSDLRQIKHFDSACETEKLDFSVLPLHPLSNQIVTNNFINTAQPTIVWKNVFLWFHLYCSQVKLANIRPLEPVYQNSWGNTSFLVSWCIFYIHFVNWEKRERLRTCKSIIVALLQIYLLFCFFNFSSSSLNQIRFISSDSLYINILFQVFVCLYLFAKNNKQLTNDNIIIIFLLCRFLLSLFFSN